MTFDIAPGDPNWIDLGTTDLDDARRFYGELFGWATEVGPPETGGYTMALLDGEPVAGLMQLMPEQIAMGVPPHWTPYFAADDIHKRAAAIKEAGGQIFAEPMDVLELGKMAIGADPTGAGFGLWEPGTHRGFGLKDTPGAFDWTECCTRDTTAAAEFYAHVLGWATEPMDESYLIFTNDGRGIAGLMDASVLPPEVPNNWTSYFNTPDVAATLHAATSLGGSVMREPTAISQGTFAILTDPQGAAFGVFQASPA